MTLNTFFPKFTLEIESKPLLINSSKKEISLVSSLTNLYHYLDLEDGDFSRGVFVII